MRTSLYSILCIGIRLAAVLLAVNTLAGIPGIYSAIWHGDWQEDAWLLTGLFVGLLILAFLLWVFPGALARLAAGKASQQVFESPIEATELQYIAFSILGLWLCFGAIYGLTDVGLRELILRHYLRVNTGLDMSELNAQSIASLASNVIKLSLGVALVFGARGLVGVLRHVRYTSLPSADDGEDAVVKGGEKS